MEEKVTFQPLNEDEQKKLMSENVALREHNQRMAQVIQQYQSGMAVKRMEFLFKVLENTGFVFNDDDIAKARNEIAETLWPKSEEEDNG